MKIRIGRVEIAFAAAWAAYAALSFAPDWAWIKFLLRWSTLFLGGWTAVRLSRQAVLDALWSLRNRLLVAYLLIAVVPVVLILALLGLGTYLLSGQLAIYLITTEIERSHQLLRAAASRLATAPPPEFDQRASLFLPSLTPRFPHLEVHAKGDRNWIWPDGVAALELPQGWQPGSTGLVMKNGLLYGMAYAKGDARQIVMLYPITRDLLGETMPSLAEINFLRLEESSIRPLAHRLGAPASVRNRLPLPWNRFDYEVDHGERIEVPDWSDPARNTSLVLAVRTRPSAVLRAIFPQRLDFGKETIPMLIFLVGILFLIAELVALFIGISITRSITGAVHQLYEGTSRIAAGAFGTHVRLRGDDQLADLGRSFNQMSSNLERLVQVEREQERVNADLRIASEVQAQLYPKRVPVLPSLRITAAYNPARVVSGDYYDFQEMNNDRVAIAIGDVAGKGISAALLMASVQSAFRSRLRELLQMPESAMSPAELVSILNRHVHAYTTPEKFATFFFGVLDGRDGAFTYTNAGHLPPLLVHRGEASRLDVNGMVIGAFPFARYEESRAVLEPGDLMVFFTDGITEPENEYGEQFGEDRLTELILRNVSLEDNRIFQLVMDDVRRWAGDGELQDDMTLLLVRKT